MGGRYFAMVAAICFAAGLNVYATVATAGLLARAGAVILPAALHPIQSWWVIGACGVLFVVEFFGDKIPAFDLIWNALHTFVRIPIAAWFAYEATSQLSPAAATFVLGCGRRDCACGAQRQDRGANCGDAVAGAAFEFCAERGRGPISVFLVWFATKHPYTAAAIVAVALIFVIVTIRFVWRALRSLFAGAEQRNASVKL